MTKRKLLTLRQLRRNNPLYRLLFFYRLIRILHAVNADEDLEKNPKEAIEMFNGLADDLKIDIIQCGLNFNVLRIRAFGKVTDSDNKKLNDRILLIDKFYKKKVERLIKIILAICVGLAIIFSSIGYLISTRKCNQTNIDERSILDELKIFVSPPKH